MVSFALLSIEEIAIELATRARNRRLALNLTQEGMARRSGVALGTLKQFERTGRIALMSYLRLAVVLRDEAALENLLLEPQYQSLEDVMQARTRRRRGRNT